MERAEVGTEVDALKVTGAGEAKWDVTMRPFLVHVDEIEPSAYNPRQADAMRLDLIELSLRKLGFVLPIYVNRRGGILSGHQRHLVAKRMGCEQVPVCVVGDRAESFARAVNVAFNRATNDMSAGDSPKTLGDALAHFDLAELGAALPDREPDTPEFFPVLNMRALPATALHAANEERMDRYATAITGKLAVLGIFMPTVVRRSDLRIMNGVGRVGYAMRLIEAERSLKRIGGSDLDCVFLTDEEADFAYAMLNFLTMDFALESRYEDVLRFNSFRRSHHIRYDVGPLYSYLVTGTKAAKYMDVTDPEVKRTFVERYGVRLLDFGCGHGRQSEMAMEAFGVKVDVFEPYRIISPGSDVISPELSRSIARTFLERVGEGTRWNTVLNSAVMNSVPFASDREHIMRLFAACCLPQGGRLLLLAYDTSRPDYQYAAGEWWESDPDRAAVQVGFTLSYEPGITLGFGTSNLPKVQKLFEIPEFREMLSIGFREVKIQKSGGNLFAVCDDPIMPSVEDLGAAIDFEFNLPYPDGQRMGLVDEARRAFAARFGLPELIRE